MRIYSTARLQHIMPLTWLILIGASRPEAPSTQPVHGGSRMIRSEHLVLEVMDPAAPDRYHTGVRFTPLAAVISVQCDGREFLFHKPNPDPAKDVAGLFAEFDIHTDPPGFADAPVGGTFVKVGVGRLIKTEVEYKFYTQHPVQKLAQTVTKWSDDTVTSIQTLPTADGLGYTLQSDLKVHDRTLTIDWTLTNTGTKPFTTQQYHHNCFSFVGRPIAPGYTLTLPFDFTAVGLRGSVRQTGREINFTDPIKKPLNVKIDYPADYAGPNTVVVRDAATHMSVTTETSEKGSGFVAHVADIYLCPEQFIDITVQPGETKSWRRTYTFEAPPS